MIEVIVRQGRAVNWPHHGDESTFRRALATRVGLGGATVGLLLAATAWRRPDLLVTVAPLAAGALLLVAIWVHGAARSIARRSEIERSFAGLTVLHLGQRYVVSRTPLIGEYPSRRHAARSAVERGCWAIVVRAWDRYYLLQATPASTPATQSPVSFRSRAVADVVPAISDGAAIA